MQLYIMYYIIHNYTSILDTKPNPVSPPKPLTHTPRPPLPKRRLQSWRTRPERGPARCVELSYTGLYTINWTLLSY